MAEHRMSTPTRAPAGLVESRMRRRGARPVRRAARGNGPVETPAPRPGSTPTRRGHRGRGWRGLVVWLLLHRWAVWHALGCWPVAELSLPGLLGQGNCGSPAHGSRSTSEPAVACPDAD